MEEKNLRSNRLNHLFETLLQQQEERLRNEEVRAEALEVGIRDQAERERIPLSMATPVATTGATGRKRGNENAARHPHHGGHAHLHSPGEWSAEAVSCLLDSYAEKFSRGRGMLRNSDWEEVACTVNARDPLHAPKTVKQCRDKLDTLKKRYKHEKKKAVETGSGKIAWPLFNKMDEMMNSQSRVPRIPGGVDAGVQLPFADHSHADVFTLGHEPPRNALTAEDVGVAPPRKKGKMTMLDDTEGLSEAEDSDTSSQQLRQDKHSSRTGSLDEGSHSRRGLGQGGQSSARKHKINTADPIQALADAIVNFSDVFARIEMAKMEIYTKMKLEIAKLELENLDSRSSSSASSSES